ncbi:hypothetical protein MLD38_018713 [Melastoma candidum]|uniref:Uncharacterized protein n=1 Tax=Melastoma candidum TaxID=119954 RepID=A0ACB9QYP8_9MYRT|nr:hypothetical protein MLD38_018713 [Melastoma candidum]
MKDPPNPNPNFALPTTQQLLDSLTSHISIYSSNSGSASSSSRGGNSLRSSILRWFSSLTPLQRQSHLSFTHRDFVLILLQMIDTVRSRGPSAFLILPDLPSENNLPSLCSRALRGLVRRVAESRQSHFRILESALLFNSREGEDMGECGLGLGCLDSVTVGEGLVESVDDFVGVMDEVSRGGFLRGGEEKLGADDWVELGWLKGMGYYGIEEFLANRFEVALRLAWLSSDGGGGGGGRKKRGVKLKDKFVSGSAANVFWRRKGCMDWWSGLDKELRKKFVRLAVGKSAKNLVGEILREAKGGSLKDEFSASNIESSHKIFSIKRTIVSNEEFDFTIMSDSLSPHSLKASIFKRFLVLQKVISVLHWLESSDREENLFFSSLTSVATIADCIVRKLRGLLMVTYLDSTKLDLLGDQSCNPLPNKSKEKPSASRCGKKDRNSASKKANRALASYENRLPKDKSKTRKDPGTSSAKIENLTLTESGGLPFMPQERATKDSVQDMAGKPQKSARRSKRGKHKKKSSNPDLSNEAKSFKSSFSASSSSCNCLDQGVNLPADCDNQSAPTDGKKHLIKNCVLASTSCSNARSQHKQNGFLKSSGDDPDGDCDVKSSSFTLDCNGSANAVGGCPMLSSTLATLDSKSSDEKPTCNLYSMESNSTLLKGEIDSIEDVNGSNGQPVLSAKQNTPSLTRERTVNSVNGESHLPGHMRSADCRSHEWPNIAFPDFSSRNANIPPAADRLHLDVGLNWQNHFCQPFLSTVHQTRNSPIENGRKQIFSRPLPMSLDWPPMVRNAGGIAASLTCGYDSAFIPRRQSAFHQGFTSNGLKVNATVNANEKKYRMDFKDMNDLTSRDLKDEFDSHWIPEEDFEIHGMSALDYNQYFGGGVMYWNASDYRGSGFSRPPSLSSDDSFWAWQEAEMNRTVDDMVAYSSSYSTNGLTSPTTASYCSPFDQVISGHQALGYVMTGNEIPGQVLHASSTCIDKTGEDEGPNSTGRLPVDAEGKAGESFPYPVLRPIVIPSNILRERSEYRSPCVPPTRREQPRIKRPPSPVVLCVPRAPRPPPPSPVGESGKRRGFPTVRSGSSSPRHWSIRSSYNDGTISEDGCLQPDGPEIVLPSWRSNSLPNHQVIQPLPGSLLQDHLIALSQLAYDKDHPDVSIPVEPPDSENSPLRKTSLGLIHSLLHDEIDSFCKQVAAENASRKPYINWAIKRVTRSLQVLWPRSRTNIFGSTATGLSLPSSDVDLVVCLPPVRNMEPIKEAGILEGRNGIKETFLQHAARYLANQEWVKGDSLKTVENTAVPIIMLVVEVPYDLATSAVSNVHSQKEEQNHDCEEPCDLGDINMGFSEDSGTSLSHPLESLREEKDSKSVRLDISFKASSHTGLQTTKLVKELSEQFPAITPLALVLKRFLADRSLDQSYSGGLSSYCLVLLITRFLQHEHHLGRLTNQNLGSLLMDFLYFYGNVFDPRHMRISVRGSGLYLNRERGYSIDPIHIDDPLFPANNVGRNCFRIHQCIKAFAEAYSILEHELSCLPRNGETCTEPPDRLLPKIIPTIDSV